MLPVPEREGAGGGLFLDRDLQEIRALRKQLEESIRRNDQLREQLDKNLKSETASSTLTSSGNAETIVGVVMGSMKIRCQIGYLL